MEMGKELHVGLVCFFFNPFIPKVSYKERGLVSEETVVLRRWGSETRKFGLSTELIM